MVEKKCLEEEEVKKVEEERNGVVGFFMLFIYLEKFGKFSFMV